MVLQVTQDTFNEAVKENMELLDLTEEDARVETLNQFRSQGADVSNIIMESSLATVSSCLSKIKDSLRKVNIKDKEILAELRIINHELLKDLTVRVHAGKEGTYDILINCLKKMDKTSLPEVVETLASLCNGYPDLLTDEGIEYMIKFLNRHSVEILIINTLKWLKVSVVRHERNRAALITLGIADKLRHVLHHFPTDEAIIIEACQAVRAIVADDDVRVVAGNAHEYARSLASELLCLLTRYLHEYVNNEPILHELLQTVSVLIVRNEFCIKVHEQNGVQYVIDAMVTLPDSERVNRQCLILLKGLAGSDEVKEPIVRAGAAPLIISAMNRHKKSAKLISASCTCISALTLRSAENGKAFADARGPDMLIECMTAFKDNPILQTKACAAIRNHISRCPEAKEEYLQLGVEDMLNQLKITEGKLEFEAKCVLKELGCNVQLEEQWKGLGQQLTN